MPKAIKLEKAPNSTNPSSNSNAITTPDFSSLIEDDDISTTGDWMNINNKSNKSNISTVTSTVKTEMPTIKKESGGVSRSAPEMEGSGKNKNRQESDGNGMIGDHQIVKCNLIF